jgi:DNA-binding XRE family transcriptional regulator
VSCPISEASLKELRASLPNCQVIRWLAWVGTGERDPPLKPNGKKTCTASVAMTGYGQESDRQRSLEAGFDHHLVKPGDFGKVLTVMQVQCEHDAECPYLNWIVEFPTSAETFGERLNRLRNAAGFSQNTLAIAAGVPAGTLRNLEYDRRGPLLETAKLLARALGVTLDELAGVDGTKESKRRKGK